MDALVNNILNTMPPHRLHSIQPPPPHGGRTEGAKATEGGGGLSPHNLTQIEETAREFEAVFVAEMMKPMFKELKTDGMFGGGKGEEVFRGMMLQEYGKNIASSGALGIADNIKAAMIRMQAEANGATAHLNTNSQTPDTKKETV
jgi:Rod binding domain-containing protein